MYVVCVYYRYHTYVQYEVSIYPIPYTITVLLPVCTLAIRSRFMIIFEQDDRFEKVSSALYNSVPASKEHPIVYQPWSRGL